MAAPPFPFGNVVNVSIPYSTSFGASPNIATNLNGNASMCPVIAQGLGPVDGGPPHPGRFSTACSCSKLFSSHAATILSRFTNRSGAMTQTITTFTDSTYQPPENCCIRCWVGAREVQVLYWPIETGAPKSKRAATLVRNQTALAQNTTLSAPPSTYILTSDGKTFISPSVYVAYHDLEAYTVCPSFGWNFRRGKSYNTTLAYEPGQLSTSLCISGTPAPFLQFAAINYTEFQFSTKALSRCHSAMEAIGGTRSDAGPFFSMPRDVTLLDPSWNTCIAQFNGVFDPPHTLEKAAAMVPTNVDPPGPLLSPPARPGHIPASEMVPPTPTPSSDDTFVSSRPDPPSGASPPSPSPTSNNLGPQDPGSSNDSTLDQDPPQPAEQPDIMTDDVLEDMFPPFPSFNFHPAGQQDPSSPEDIIQEQDPPEPVNLSGVTVDDPATDDAAVSQQGVNVNVPPASKTDPQMPSINGQQIQPAEGGGVVVGGATLQPGSQTTQDDGPPISIGHNNVVVDGSITITPTPQSDSVVHQADRLVMSTPDPAPVVANGYTIAPLQPIPGSDADSGVENGGDSNGRGGIAIGGATYTIGATTRLPNAASLSVASDHVILAGSSYILPTLIPPSPVLVAGNPISRASNGDYVIGGSTITPGAPTSAYGHAISAGPSFVVINGETYPAPPASDKAEATKRPPFHPAITLANGAIVTAGQAPTTISGTAVALDSDGGSLIVNGKSFLVPDFSTISDAAMNPAMTVADQVFTAANTGFTIGSQTVAPGGAAITVAGTVVSLDPGGNLMVGDSSTVLLSSTGRERSETTVGGVVVEGGSGPGQSGRAAPGGNGTADTFTGEGGFLVIGARRLWLMIGLVILIRII